MRILTWLKELGSRCSVGQSLMAILNKTHRLKEKLLIVYKYTNCLTLSNLRLLETPFLAGKGAFSDINNLTGLGKRNEPMPMKRPAQSWV